MKYKKYSYIIILIMVLMIGINRIYAEELPLTNQPKYTENTNDRKENILKQIANTKTENPQCDYLFGDKDDSESLRYLINEILMYPKIIVPILVILLGILDLGKAVIASKEDAMRKAQSTFIKRVLLGVLIFFVPVIVDLIMAIADIVWAGTGYTSCNF